MFDFAERTKDMTASEILNYYRNLYYAEPQVTERGIVANAINDVLPRMVEVVRCKDCARTEMFVDIVGNTRLFCTCFLKNQEVDSDDFCSYGKRKEKQHDQG
jgi:hypothetical protein